jgi:hypothetical protein
MVDHRICPNAVKVRILEEDICSVASNKYLRPVFEDYA